MLVILSDREIAQVMAALRNWQTDSLNEDGRRPSAVTSSSTRRSPTTRSTRYASASTSPAVARR